MSTARFFKEGSIDVRTDAAFEAMPDGGLKVTTCEMIVEFSSEAVGRIIDVFSVDREVKKEPTLKLVSDQTGQEDNGRA